VLLIPQMAGTLYAKWAVSSRIRSLHAAQVLHNFLLLKMDVEENTQSHIGEVRQAFAAVGGSSDGEGCAEGQKIGYRHCSSLPEP
jgi:hypothetical protein